MNRFLKFLILVLVVLSYIGGGITIRDAGHNGWKFGDGTLLTNFWAGGIEITAPLWYPVREIGKLVLNGVN